MNNIESGIHLLPVEILEVFFQECVPYPTRNHPGPPLSHSHPAVVLSHVCHDWRELALSTPSIWSRMHILAPYPESFIDPSVQWWRDRADNVASLIEVWSKRSAGCSLTIVVDLPTTAWNTEGSHEVFASYNRILEQVFLCSNRWQKVVISMACSIVPVRSFILASTRVSASDFPILRTLELHLIPNDRSVSMIDRTSASLMKGAFFAGPMLRSVELGGHWDTTASLKECVQPWAPLTELKVDLSHAGGSNSYLSAYHALQLLESFQQLIKVSFVLQLERPVRAIERETAIKLPRLQSLSLQGVPMGPGFVRSLVLPSLKAMSLVFDGIEYDDSSVLIPVAPVVHEEGILELLRRFGPQLTALALNTDALSFACFPSCLDSLNHDRLETLSLIDHHFPIPQFNRDRHAAHAKGAKHHVALAYLANPLVLPNLKYFEMTIANVHPDRRCDVGLVEVIAARRGRNVDADEEKEPEAGIQGSADEPQLDANTARSRFASRSRIRHVHVALSWSTHFNVIEELRRRRVDMDADPFKLLLRYSTSRQSVGEILERPWEKYS